MSLIPATASPRLSLSQTLHASTIPLQVYDVVLTTPTRAFVWNFTVSFVGKDTGSDRFNLVIDAAASTAAQVPLVLLFSDQNLTEWLATTLTTHNSQELAYAAWVPSSYNSALGAFSQAIGSGVTATFFPLASGGYHIVVMNPNAFLNLVPGVQASLHVEIHGFEAWTTTTIG